MIQPEELSRHKSNVLPICNSPLNKHMVNKPTIRGWPRIENDALLGLQCHISHIRRIVFSLKKHQFCFDSMDQSWKISPLDASPSLAKKMSEKWVDRAGPKRTGLVVFLLQKLAIIRIVYRLVVSKRYVFLGLGWSPVTILSFVDLKLAILRSSFVLKIKWFNFLPWFVCSVGFWFCKMSLPWFRETKLCQGPAWPQCTWPPSSDCRWRLRFQWISKISMAMQQEPKSEVPTMCKAYVLGLNFREYPHTIWSYMVRLRISILGSWRSPIEDSVMIPVAELRNQWCNPKTWQHKLQIRGPQSWNILGTQNSLEKGSESRHFNPFCLGTILSSYGFMLCVFFPLRDAIFMFWQSLTLGPVWK